MSPCGNSAAEIRVRISGLEAEVRTAAARIAAVLDGCTAVRVKTARSGGWVYGYFEAFAKPRPGAVLPVTWTAEQVRVRLVPSDQDSVLIGLALTAAVLAPDPEKLAPEPVLGEKNEGLIYYRTVGQLATPRPERPAPRVSRTRRRR